MLVELHFKHKTLYYKIAQSFIIKLIETYLKVYFV